MNCSECGRPVEQSLPAARPGSPYQQHPLPTAVLVTWWEAIVRPSALFCSIAIDRASAAALLRISLAVAGVLLSVGPWTDFARWFGLNAFVAWVINLAISITALWGLTHIEMLGVRTFGNRRGWRITHDVALSVCAHAAVGWVITGALFLASLMLPRPKLVLKLPPAFGNFSVDIAGVLAPFSALMVGLFVFELLVYLGVRRCRFANARSTSKPPAQPAEQSPAGPA